MEVLAQACPPRPAQVSRVTFSPAIGYLVTLLGPGLSWPDWVLNVSPFTHLALVPAEPWGATAGIVLTCLGLLFFGAGLLAFQPRDVAGS